MKKLLVLSTVFALSACAQTSEGKLNQTVYDIASAYHTLAVTMPDVMNGKVPGVHVSDENKLLIKKSSQAVFNEIQSLEESIEQGKTITNTAVSALQVDFASLEDCFLKANLNAPLDNSCSNIKEK